EKVKIKKVFFSLSLCLSLLRGYSVGELDQHIKQLHEYNDIKDIGQMLLGKLGKTRYKKNFLSQLLVG
uniref:DNA repair protein SWI5 homolog n=1 Tax=Erpetoichthys calabaricus TaxID=27687 RepID=A0A8C4SMM8_ERPCA